MPLNSNGNLTDLADTGYTWADLQNFFNQLSAETGASVESGDVQLLANKLMGEAGFIKQLGGNPQGAFDAFREQYRRRGGAPTGVSSVATEGSAKPPDPKYAAQQIINANPPKVPPAIAGNVVTIGPAALVPSGASTGPTGLVAGPQIYPDGAGTAGGLLLPTSGGGGLNLNLVLLIAGAAAVAYFVFRRK